MNLVMWGLLLDAVGFALVFIFGGFNFARSVLVREDDRSGEMAKWKWLGAVMVVSGFVLQFLGNLEGLSHQ